MSSPSLPPSSADAAPTPSSLTALWVVVVVGVGAVLAGVLAGTYHSFDLDRFFVPKELVLHLVALLAALPLVVRCRRLALSGVDLALLGFLGFSAISALLAPNYWLAGRALAVTWSSLVIFWSVTVVAAGHARRERVVVGTLVIAVLAVVCTALLQAYGMDSEHFSLNRAPGGTLGNRNFVAHLAVIAAPLLGVAAVGARRTVASVVATVSLALVSAVLVLSRTRAAWLALAACAVVLLPGVWRARRRWQVAGLRRRLLVNAVVVAVTVVGAAFVPNALDWRSASPYLDSVKNLTDYNSGSGHGRLVQYGNSLRLALRHPVFGVGTGNWSVAYLAAVATDDPSLDLDSGMTANPWPSSDWVAFASERGLPAVILLALAWLLLLADAGRQMLAATDPEAYLRGLALAGVVIASAVVAAFDAVLLLPTPALVVFTAFGALRSAPRHAWPITRPRTRRALAAAVVAVGVVACTRSALMFDAMRHYEQGAVSTAVREDPGNYRIQMRLARRAESEGRCDLVNQHAGAAHKLFPHAPGPRGLLAACRRSAGH
jgi:hypothetical protein